MRPRGAVGWFVTVLSSSWFEHMASSNHAMERTAERRTLHFEMTSTFPLIHSRDSFSLRPEVYVTACQSVLFRTTRALGRHRLLYCR